MNKNITLEDRINKTALEMFSNEGFDQVTVNHICKAVGITKPTFYRYVSSKEEILDNYFHFDPRSVDPVWDQITEGNFWRAIEYGFQLCFEHYLSMGTEILSRLMIFRMNRNDISFQNDPDWIETMTRLISQAQTAGQIRNTTPPETLLELLQSVAQGYCFFSCTEEDSFTGLEEFSQILWTVALAVPEC